jgi:hypothetical protein
MTEINRIATEPVTTVARPLLITQSTRIVANRFISLHNEIPRNIPMIVSYVRKTIWFLARDNLEQINQLEFYLNPLSYLMNYIILGPINVFKHRNGNIPLSQYRVIGEKGVFYPKYVQALSVIDKFLEETDSNFTWPEVMDFYATLDREYVTQKDQIFRELYAMPFEPPSASMQSNFSPKKTSTSPSDTRSRKPNGQIKSKSEKNYDKLKRSIKSERSRSRDNKGMEPQAFLSTSHKITADNEVLNVASSVATSLERLCTVVEGDAGTTFLEVKKVIDDLKNPEQTDDTKEYFTKVRKLFFSDITSADVIDAATKSAIALALASSGIHYLYSRDKKSLVIFAVASVMGVAYLNAEIIGQLFEGVFSFKDQAEPQIDSGDVEGLVSSLVACLIGTSIHKEGYNAKTYIKGLSEFKRSKDSLLSIVKVCLQMLERAVNTFRKEVLGLSPLRFIDSGCQEIDEFIKECDLIQNELDNAIFYFTAENLHRIKKLEEIGNRLSREIINKQPYKDLAQPVLSMLHFVREAKKKFLGANPSFEGFRQEPVGLILIGGAGVGKSLCMEHFTNAVCAKILTPEELEVFKVKPKEFAYNRQFENDFWDGITPRHKVLYFDDFAQSKTIAGSPNNEFMDIVRAINGFPYNVHIAEITGKGCTYMHAEFVFATTNDRTLENQSVKNQEAIRRRFHLSFTVVPKDEFSVNPGDDFMSQRLDIKKLPIGELGISSLSPHSVNFVEFDLISQRYGKVWSFHDVCDQLLEMHAIQTKRYKQFKLELKNTFDYYNNEPQMKYTNIEFCDDIIMDDLEIEFTTDSRVNEFIEQLQLILRDTNHEDYDEVVAKLDIQDKQLRKHKIYSDAGILAILKISDLVGRSYIYKFSTLSVNEFIFYVNSLNLTRVPEVQLGFSVKKCFKSVISCMKLAYSRLKDILNVFLKSYGLDTKEKVLKILRDNVPLLGLIVALYGSLYAVTHSIGNRKAINLISKYVDINSWDIQDLNFAIEAIKAKQADFPNHDQDQVYEVARKVAELDSNQKILFEALFKEMEAQSVSGVHRTSTGKQIVAKSSKEMKAFINKAQAGDENGDSLANSIIRGNSWEMWVQRTSDEPEQQCMGYILMVRGRIAVMPYHFVKKLFFCVEHDLVDSKCKVTLKKEGKELFFTIADIIANHESEYLSHNDMCLVRFPKKMQPCRDIVKNFSSTNTLKNTRQYDYILMATGTGIIQGTAQALTQAWPVQSRDMETYHIQKGYTYKANTRVGDCGKVFFVMNSGDPVAKIFGLHVSGIVSSNWGFAGAIVREDLESCLNLFDGEIIDESIDKPIEKFSIAQDQFFPLYRVDKGPSQCRVTKIQRSKIEPTWCEIKTKPCRLTSFQLNGQTINPMDIGLSKYCTPDVMFDDYIGRAIVDSMYDNLMHKSKTDFIPRVFTFEEAVMGIPGLLRSIPRGTSMGWPWTSENNKLGGKKAFFGNGADYDLTSPAAERVKERVFHIIEMAKASKRVLHIFTDFPKDQRKSKEKVDKGTGRVVSGAPCCYTIAFKMYFGAFMVWTIVNRIDNGYANGMNVYSHEWNKLAELLLQFGVNIENIGAGDYEKYDGSQKPQIHWLLLEIIQRWYGWEDAKIREVLWLELVNSRHILDKLIYCWVSSLPSGHPFTIFINNLYNDFNLRLAWTDINGSLDSLKDYDANVFAMFAGDDNAFATSFAYRLKFTEFNIGKSLIKIGMKYTSEDKGELKVNLRNLGDIDFLKRSFRFCEYERRFVSPLSMDTILELPLWTKKQHDADFIAKENTKMALEELSLHGEKIFNQYAKKMIDACFLAYGEYPKIVSYSSNYRAALHEDMIF